jgi:uncharacterized protein YdhG (YjbR/CyaY superfamily)
MKAGPKPETVDDYLASVRPDHRAVLERLRRTIRSAAPKAEECISYGIPTFRVGGKMLVSFAAAAKHCSLYAGALPIKAHRRELAAYSLSKGTIRFQAEDPIPATLVRKLIRTRLAERSPE